MKYLAEHLCILCFALFMLGSRSCDKTLPGPSLSEKFQKVLDLNLEKFHGKGISAAIHFQGAEIWSGECGISNGNLPIREDMAFCIGSVTKTFIAALCLQLANEKIIELEDPLDTWLPAYPNIDNSITIRQLLNNTSGIYNLSDNTELWNKVFEVPDKKWSIEELMGSFVMEPYAEPGEGWYYSNTNYILLGEIIRNATGTDISYQLRTRFFEPLGLDHTFLYVEEEMPSRIAHAWFDMSGDGGYEDISLISQTGIYSVLSSSAAIFSTGKDLAKWCSELLQGTVLNETGLHDMLDEVCKMPGSDDIGCGMGIFVISSNNNTGFELVGYTGRTFGYLSSMFSVTEFGISIAVLINEDNSEFLDAVTTELIMAAISEHAPQQH